MKTYLAKLKVDEISEKRILDTLEANKQAWNEASKIYFLKPKGLKVLHSQFYKQFRKLNPQTPSQVVIKAQQDVIAAFNSIRRNKHKITEPPVKKKLSMQLDKRIYKVIGTEIQLTAIGKGRAKAQIIMYPRLTEALKNGCQDPKIFYRNSELWLAFPVQTLVPPQTNNLCIGVDLGIKRAAVTSEGVFISRKAFNRQLRKFSFNKRKLQAKNTAFHFISLTTSTGIRPMTKIYKC